MNAKKDCSILYQSYTDHQLLARLRDDDETALAEVYDRYWKLLFYLGAKKLYNTEDAKELVQDIFINFWERRKELAIEGSLKSYLAAAAKFRIYNLLSKQHRTCRNMAAMPLPETCVASEAETRISLNEMSALVESETAKLPPKCRQVFQMSRNEHLSHKEIAEKLGVSKKTVDNQIIKALHILKASIHSLRIFS